ncbi:MAG: hypothetical protein ACT4PO_06660 [Actinomycetota bacterium]
MTLLDRIEEKARTLQPRRLALSVVAFPLYGLGWLLGTIVRGIWWAGAWAWSALAVGFKDGRKR